MKKIISYNVNGIRAAAQKGLYGWIADNNFDIVCLQETKAQPDQIDVSTLEQMGYCCYWHSAVKKGYSGVGILSKQPADNIVVGCGLPEYDSEGRILRADYGDLTVISVYIPSGTSGDERQGFKMKFLSDFWNFVHQLVLDRPKLIISGDFNICHRPIDIHDPVGNKNSTGFLPEEREWMEQFFNSGFTDTFRFFYPELAHQYSWWSFRAGARGKNKGWRIDYHAVSQALTAQLSAAAIFPDITHSDHCPIYIEIDG